MVCRGSVVALKSSTSMGEVVVDHRRRGAALRQSAGHGRQRCDHRRRDDQRHLQIQQVSAGQSQSLICGATVVGHLQAHNNASPVAIGTANPASCPGNSIGGNLQVDINSAAVQIYYYLVSGNPLQSMLLARQTVYEQQVLFRALQFRAAESA
jgi:hypothetical protein